MSQETRVSTRALRGIAWRGCAVREATGTSKAGVADVVFTTTGAVS